MRLAVALKKDLFRKFTTNDETTPHYTIVGRLTRDATDCHPVQQAATGKKQDGQRCETHTTIQHSGHADQEFPHAHRHRCAPHTQDYTL